MSTAGKVLTVLILLVMIVWVVVLSEVTQLNANWQQKIAQQDKQFESLQAEATKATSDIRRLTQEARLEQDATDRDLREVLGRIAAAERRQSATTESLTRLKIQVADYQAAVERSKVNLATREAEFVKGEEDLVTKREEIARAQAVNVDLRGQLARLQDEFKRLLADNSAQLGKAPSSAPAGRPATGNRPSPAS
jgi:chromosome segregation ATPase